MPVAKPHAVAFTALLLVALPVFRAAPSVAEDRPAGSGAPTLAELAGATVPDIRESPLALRDGEWAGEPFVEGGAEPTAEEEIAALIDAIGASGCTFVRNGRPGSAAEARAHVERKYRYAREEVKSAESFIENVASRSSMTGRPYLVDCPGEPREAAAQWLRRRLAEIRGR